jgi:hypothetical protein
MLPSLFVATLTSVAQFPQTCTVIPANTTATLPANQIGYYSCVTSSTSPTTSDIISIARRILSALYELPPPTGAGNCGELAKFGTTAFYICGTYDPPWGDDGVVAGADSILRHCGKEGRAEGVFRVSEGAVLVVTVGDSRGLVVGGVLKDIGGRE